MEERPHWERQFWRLTRALLCLKRGSVTEAEALRIFPEPERVEGSQVAADDAGHIGWGFASGLVRREDGAMVQAFADALLGGTLAGQ